MIKDEYVEMKWITNFSKHFLSLGYEKKKQGEKFSVKISDIPHNSYVKVTCICDKCGKEFLGRYACIYDSEVHFCDDCKIERINYNVKKKYNVDYSGQIPDAIEKRVKTFKSHYGKIENPQGSKELSIRKNKKFKATLRQHSGIYTSNYQYHIYELLEDTCLNYKVNNYYIDVAYSNEKIAIEYDGPGHYFDYICGRTTKKEALFKDKVRNHNLTQLGWKIIFIKHQNGKKQYFHDNNMIYIINLAKQHLYHTSYKWVCINVDKNCIYGKGFKLFTDDEGNFKSL